MFGIALGRLHKYKFTYNQQLQEVTVVDHISLPLAELTGSLVQLTASKFNKVAVSCANCT
jgi:hypothetical protein